MREDVRRALEGLPDPRSWEGLSPDEAERRERTLAAIAERIVEDGPRVARPGPERGRQFMPFAALRGYEGMVRDVEREAGG